MQAGSGTKITWDAKTAGDTETKVEAQSAFIYFSICVCVCSCNKYKDVPMRYSDGFCVLHWPLHYGSSCLTEEQSAQSKYGEKDKNCAGHCSSKQAYVAASAAATTFTAAAPRPFGAAVVAKCLLFLLIFLKPLDQLLFLQHL